MFMHVSAHLHRQHITMQRLGRSTLQLGIALQLAWLLVSAHAEGGIRSRSWEAAKLAASRAAEHVQPLLESGARQVGEASQAVASTMAERVKPYMQHETVVQVAAAAKERLEAALPWPIPGVEPAACPPCKCAAVTQQAQPAGASQSCKAPAAASAAPEAEVPGSARVLGALLRHLLSFSLGVLCCQWLERRRLQQSQQAAAPTQQAGAALPAESGAQQAAAEAAAAPDMAAALERSSSTATKGSGAAHSSSGSALVNNNEYDGIVRLEGATPKSGTPAAKAGSPASKRHAKGKPGAAADPAPATKEGGGGEGAAKPAPPAASSAAPSSPAASPAGAESSAAADQAGGGQIIKSQALSGEGGQSGPGQIIKYQADGQGMQLYINVPNAEALLQRAGPLIRWGGARARAAS